MPGEQYTNLYQQAQAAPASSRGWSECCRMYAEVNRMFGDIVKVTPTSKVVGDMERRLFMVANSLTPDEVIDGQRELAFPESVVEFFEGRLGQPGRRISRQAAAAASSRDGTPITTRRPAQSARRPTSKRPARALAKPLQRPIADHEVVTHLLLSARLRGVSRAHQVRYLRHRRGADAGLLLRHGEGRGSFHRDRAGQDADREIPDDRRRPSGRPTPGLLRVERPGARRFPRSWTNRWPARSCLIPRRSQTTPSMWRPRCLA